MSDEELKAAGANESSQHEDFMFGTKEMNIDGIQQYGTVVPVFRNGNFVIQIEKPPIMVVFVYNRICNFV